MPDFIVSADQFENPYVNINGTHTLSVSKRKCLKFAVSVGLPAFMSVSKSSAQAIALATYKACAIKCAIDFSGDTLTRPRAYGRMDQSEKANISYWTGMTFAAIIANDLLSVPHLVHATSFKPKQFKRKNPKSKRLADLFGKDNNGQWHVIEAKARQQTPSDKVRTSWKVQAETVTAIKGRAIATSSYCLTNIRRSYSAELIDPPPDDEAIKNNIEFEDNELTRWYYSPLLDWLSRSHRKIVTGNTPVLFRLATYDPSDREYVFLGLTERAFRAVSDSSEMFFSKSIETDNAFIGSDGIVVLTSKQRRLD